MSYRSKPKRNLGCPLAAVTFVIFGIPWLVLYVSGDRSCDIASGEICAWSKSTEDWLALAAVVSVCVLLAILTNAAVAAIRRKLSSDRNGN